MVERLTEQIPGTSDEVKVFVDRANRRVWVMLPVSLSCFEEDGLVMRTSREVCGDGAVCPFDIGAKLGAFAFCAKEAISEWRHELGLGEPQ
jgi:hypothetical protein